MKTQIKSSIFGLLASISVISVSQISVADVLLPVLVVQGSANSPFGVVYEYFGTPIPDIPQAFLPAERIDYGSLPNLSTPPLYAGPNNPSPLTERKTAKWLQDNPQAAGTFQVAGGEVLIFDLTRPGAAPTRIPVSNPAAAAKAIQPDLPGGYLAIGRATR